jgi:hypothetical protein
MKICFYIYREERERQRHMQLQQQQFNDQKKTESQNKDGGKVEHSGKNLHTHTQNLARTINQ